MPIYLGNELIADNGLGILPTTEPDITPPANTVKIWYDNTLHIGDKVIEPNPITGVQDYSTFIVNIPNSDKTFIFPIQENTVYNMDIDWGEDGGYQNYSGSFAAGVYTGIPHTFSTQGRKYIKFKGTAVRSTNAMWNIGIGFVDNTTELGGAMTAVNKAKVIGLDCLNGVLDPDITVAGNYFMRAALAYCVNLTQAPILPKNIVSVGGNFLGSCFIGCTSLAIPPELPNITTVTGEFCASEFNGCTALQKIQKLPQGIGGVIGNSFLYSTYANCSALTDASELIIPPGLVQTGTNFLYFIFGNCSKLVKGPEINLPLLSTTSNDSMSNCFNNCTSLVDPPNINMPLLTTIGNNFLYQTFFGCAKLIAMPDLPPILATVGNNFMFKCFRGCTNLETIKPLPPIVTAGTCFLYATFQSCSNVTIYPDNFVPQIAQAINLQPLYYCFDGNTKLTRLPKLPQNITGVVAGSGTPPNYFLNGVFRNCTAATSCEGNANEQPWVKYSVITGFPATEAPYRGCTALQTPTPYASIPEIWKTAS
jgi:hypothetical protein